MVGHKLPLPPDWDRVNVSETLGKATALPALLLITPQIHSGKALSYVIIM